MTQPRTRVTVGNTPAQPARRAQATRHAVPIVVTIVEPTAAQEFTLTTGSRSEEPEMPKVKVKATVTVSGQAATVGTVRWEFWLSGQYRVRDHSVSAGYRQQQYRFAAGNTTTAPNEEKEFTLAPALLCGGTLQVKASYTGGDEVGGATATKSVDDCKVKGPDLPRAEVAAYIAAQAGDLAWLYTRMFFVETEAHPYQQFRSGGPWYGAPAGVGVVQRDPDDGEWVFPKDAVGTTNNFFPRIFWNWRRNVEEGIQYFRSVKLVMGRTDLAALKRATKTLPDPSDGVQYRAGIRRYNGGSEYRAADDGLHYVSPVPSGNDYAQHVTHVEPPEAASYPVPADALTRIWPVDPPVNVPLPRPRPVNRRP